MMKRFICFINYCILLVTIISGHVTSDYDAPQEITFYYDIENGEKDTWVLRDTMKFLAINNGNVFTPPARLPEEVIKKDKETNVTRELYRLKAVVKTSKKKEKVFHSFMKLDSLVKAGFLTSTIIHLDHSGSVIGVNIYPKKINNLSANKNNSTVTFKGPEAGPVPDVSSYVIKLEREREAKEKLSTQDNRSFLAKYWMYIVPLLMFVILSGSNADPGAAAAPRQR